jgi:oligopeptide/dipeptide ABC transporter ATP-binding protein
VNDAPLLELKDVSVTFSARRRAWKSGTALRAVRGINLTLHAGQTVALVGESGCGKTTTARVVVGLQEPTGGELLLKGEPIGTDRRGLEHGTIQMVFQDPTASLNPRMTIAESVREPLDIRRRQHLSDRKARVAAILKKVGLGPQWADRYPHELSGGQRQRAALARAIVAAPALLVCDEPTSSLDVSVQAQVINLLADLQRPLQLAILLISHDLAVVEHLADRVAVMLAGRIIEQAPTAELFATPRHPYTRDLIARTPRLDRTPTAPLLRVLSPIADGPPGNGCPLVVRCPNASSECEVDPDLRRASTLGQDHSVACHHA